MTAWLSLAEVASSASAGLAERPVAWRAGALIRHARWVQDVARWRAAFASHPGRRIALFFEDGYDFAAALYGAWHAGKEVVLPGDAQAATVQGLLPQVDGCAGLLPGAIAPADSAQPSNLHPLDLRATRLVIYTSGSSGQPLAIAKTLGQMDAEVRHLQQVFGDRLDGAEGLTVHATVTHQHIYGLLFCTLWPLAAGRPFSVERLAYPEEMALRLDGRPGVLVSSPAHLKRLPASVDWAAARARLRAVFSSGGPLPPESAQQALATLGQSPIEVYGSSETGGIAWRQRATHGDRWEPLPGVDWRIDDGILSVRSAHLADDAWWETSDRVQALPEGGFVLRGRADRIVKIEEKRVSLTGLEQAVVATGLAAEARALLVEADGGGARLALVAVPSEQGWAQLRRDGKRAFNEHLRRELLLRVERVALPRRFRYVRELPANTQGKSTEALLAALFDGVLPPAEWHERTAQRSELALELTPELRVFDGHFPGMPVLPGVVQIDWAVAFAAQCFALPPRFLRADVLKFHAPVLPPLRLVLTLEWEAGAGQLAFQYSSPAGSHSSGRLVFGPDDA
ncbi:AMP-binding protein [Ramlibacter sp.]|uniref:AMP-binding protein n=1 Tax=Ramlibacter sp. TaxID=1917967 RepID=UPI00181B6B23|nr:AMP-binding protein [Ramlibacter sp.]MBA2673225.1 AMP-binding protein [Ramlibacter sp.]